MSKKEYDLAVVIGRFQPVHNGHLPTLVKANEIADYVLVIFGSANEPRTIKNPFTFEEREEMVKERVFSIQEHYTKGLGAPDYLQANFLYRPVEDRKYQEHEWVAQVRQAARDVIKEHNIAEGRTPKVAILGHEKDESSYYIKNFRPWEVIDTGPWVGDFEHDIPVSATQIRELWFEGKFGFASGNLPNSVYRYMLDWCKKHKEEFLQLKDEYEHVKEYRRQTQQGPFPVQFLTTDAVVIQSGEILLIKRNENPGKGQWALPGGFVGQDETFFEACIRELKEETEIKVPEKVLIGSKQEEKVFDYPGRSLRGRTVSVAYSFVLDSTQPRPRVKGGDDAAEAWWFPIDEVFNMRDQIFEDHHDIIRYFVSRV